jgi:enterochelin esterase family protein
MKRSVIFILVMMTVNTGLLFSQSTGYPYESFTAFRHDLSLIGAIAEPAERKRQADEFWAKLRTANQIPFKMGDSAAMLYRGAAESVSWAGDFNGWKPGADGMAGERAGQSDIWAAFKGFPPDARLDYKIIVDGKWMLDPDNPYSQMSGMGNNSELQMPAWKFPYETQLAADVIRGTLTDNILINSQKLGYSINYKVYTPFNYALHESLPVIYVTDGHEYADSDKGAMLNILDNLIYAGEIRPVMAVFIDPREPGKDASNRRMREYVCNQQFADFLGDELVPLIDKSYKTHACPDDRVILGTSLGGMNAAWVGAVRINDFHLLGINSPAFNTTVIETFGKLDWFPFRIYMTTGTLFDTREQALGMKKILDANKVDYEYVEVNEGHSWGNWRALLDDMLRYFFPAVD